MNTKTVSTHRQIALGWVSIGALEAVKLYTSVVAGALTLHVPKSIQQRIVDQVVETIMAEYDKRAPHAST